MLERLVDIHTNDSTVLYKDIIKMNVSYLKLDIKRGDKTSNYNV
jgi:hypothetical protein